MESPLTTLSWVYIDLSQDFRKHISEAAEENGEPLIPANCMNKILNYLPQLTNINDNLLHDIRERIDNW